ncbi:unnamed protein product [Closterium sp. NIES-64]|nr:unnamed protein product [Closterium sp. NIES-64]
MATLNVLAFDPDGRPIEFATWLDDLQLFLMTNAKDGVSLFDHASGTSVAPADTAAAFDRSQWQTRDAAARLAIRNHLPITERAHFSQHKIAKALYEAVVAFYSSLATATPGRLMLPYLFPDLSSFTTADDLISHLRATDARLRAALPAEFLVENHPPMYFTLYFLITRLPDTLRSVRDHFIALDPHSLTLDDFEKHLLTAEKNILAVGAARGAPRTPLFEGRSGLLPLLVGSAAAPGATGVVGEVEVAVEGAVVEAVGEVEVVGVVVGVEVVVGMAVVPGAVAVAATVVGEEGVVVAAVVGAGVEPARRGAPVVAKGSSSSSSSRSSVSARPPRLSNFRTVLAHSSTVLPCPVVPFGELSGLHLPSFSTNLGAAPHSSSFPPIEAPLQILLLDVWGPARVRGQGHKRYFLLVVDNYTPQPLAPCLRSDDFAHTTLDGGGWRCVAVPGPPQVDPFPAPSPAPSGVSHVDPPPVTEPVEVTGDSGPAGGGPARGAASWGAEPRGAEPRGAERGGAEPGVLSLGVRSLEVLSLGVRSLEVLSLGVRSLGVLSLGVRSLRVRSLEVLSVGVPSLRVLCLGVLGRLVSSLLGAAAYVVALVVPRCSPLVGVCLSCHSSCVSGTLAVRVELLELGVPGLGIMGQCVLRLVVLCLPKLLKSLVPEVLVLEVLELLGLEVLLDLEVLLSTLELEVPVLGVLLLETLRLEPLGLEVLVLGVLLLVALVLEVLALEVLELLEVLALGVLDLEVLELLEVLALEVLELLEVLGLLVLVALPSRDCSSLRRLLRLCHRLTPCFAKFLASRLLLSFVTAWLSAAYSFSLH